MVLEVGLGGRLDAVNIVDCDVAVITTIDLDHTAWLGETREAIGREKAGIVRAGMPLVCADRKPPDSVLEQAALAGAPVYLVGENYDQFIDTGGSWCWRGSSAAETLVQVAGLPVPWLHPDVVAAAMEVLCLSGLLPDRDTLSRVLQALRLPGRFERIVDSRRSCEVILDVAHNPAAARVLADRLAGWQARGGGTGKNSADPGHHGRQGCRRSGRGLRFSGRHLVYCAGKPGALLAGAGTCRPDGVDYQSEKSHRMSGCPVRL